MTNTNTSSLLNPADIQEILEEFQGIFQTYEKYDYQWKRIIPRGGIQITHISSWGNEPHNAKWTPEEYKIESEPHHHHYDPTDRKKRKESWEVRTLRDALLFVKYYIDSGEEYKG